MREIDKNFIIATKNLKKLAEMKQILSDLPLKILSMEEAGFSFDIIETGHTFEENSIIKAKALFEKCGGMVMADDSGLEVEYLNGDPGIYSARFAGENATDAERIHKLLRLLDGVPMEKRGARFVCAITVVLERSISFTVKGSLEGFVATDPVGKKGFGYDPIFIVPNANKTFAQLFSEEKNRISHRARALIKMREILKDHLGEWSAKNIVSSG